MKHDDHFHCDICGAKYESQNEVEDHERRRHTQQGLSGISPSNEYPPSEPADETGPRKNRKFTRGHME